MDKKKLMRELSQYTQPWAKGGYYEYMHPHYKIKHIADWQFKVEEPLNEGDFYIAGFGNISNSDRERIISLIQFLKNYKIRGIGGVETSPLSNNEIIGIKYDDKSLVELFWQFGNGTNGKDNDIIPAMKECLKLIEDLRKEDFIENAYLLSSCSDTCDDLYSWYIKIII